MACSNTGFSCTPLKFLGQFCFICGTQELKVYTAIESHIGKSKNLAELLNRYCCIKVEGGLMCGGCTRKILNIDQTVKSFQASYKSTCSTCNMLGERNYNIK